MKIFGIIMAVVAVMAEVCMCVILFKKPHDEV